MRPALPLFFGLLAVLSAGVRAEDPTKIVPEQKNAQLAPGADNNDTRLAPGNSKNQLPFKRDDHVQNSRFTTPELRDKEMAPVGERRAPIDVKETREKNILERKDFPKPEVRERQMSPDNAQMYRDQPKGDMVKKYDMVAKYQDRMADAETAASQRQPKFEKRTTFDKINRFVFHRNGPDDADGNGMVSKAGGGTQTTVSGGSKKTLAAPSSVSLPIP